jgi:hypothetical protein
MSQANLVPFTRSNPGRLVLLAAAIFLLSGAVMVASDDHYAFGIGMPAAITIAFVAVGVSMGSYVKETLFTACVLPPGLWGFMYLIGELKHADARNWGYGIGLVGLLALAMAVRPGQVEA